MATVGERGRAQDEAVAVLVEPALEVQRAARDQHAVAERLAHAIERLEQRGAAPRLALVEQRALLAEARGEARERDADRVQRHAAGKETPEQRERQLQHHRVGVRGRRHRARLLGHLAVGVA